MSNISEAERDGIREEARVANFFIRLGYFTRPHIQVYPIEATRKVSDIDVLAVRFDRYLNRHLTLLEVKKDSDKTSDLFKLFGFKTYFANPDTYFVSDRISETFLDIAKTLGVKAISFSKLKQMSETEAREVEQPFNDQDIIAAESFLQKIRDEIDKELFWKYHYLWLERNPYVRFFHLQRLFGKTRYNAHSENLQILWFRKELFLESFLTVLDMACDCVSIEPDRISRYVEERFFNVGTPKEGKLKIKAGVDNLVLILRKVSEQQNQPLELPNIEVIPTYLENLVSLIKKIIEKGRYANSYLLLDDLVYRANLHGKIISIDQASKSVAVARETKTVNDILLRILHNGPIQPDFNNFV